MLFRALDAYLLPNVSPRSMPHLQNYIDTLNTQRQRITDRYTPIPGYESRIVALLRKILADAEIPKLVTMGTDLSRYFDLLYYSRQDLEAIFDAQATGMAYTNLVIARNPGNTAEFLIPVQCQDPTTDLPFEQGFDAWQDVRPLRLVDHDSLELSFHTYQDQIVFKTDYPTRAVCTLDVVALVLQYVAFLKSGITLSGQPEYLHRYVLVSLLQDIEDIWLGNVYRALLTTPEMFLTRPRFGDRMDAFYGFVGSELPIAVDELLARIAECRKGAITPAVLLKSLRLSDGDLPQFLKTLLETTTIPEQRQYLWMTYLRDVRWMEILYWVYQLQPDFVTTRNLHTYLKRDIPLLTNTRFWNNIQNHKVQQFVQHDVTDRLAKWL